MPNPFAVAASRLRSSVKSAADGGRFIGPSQDNRPQWTDWDTARAVKEGFKASAIVHACVKKLMQAAASVPWRAFTLNGDGEWEPEPTHPLSQLLDRPNEFMGRQRLMEILTAQLQLSGNCILHKIIIRGKPVELWPLPDISKVHVVPSRINWITRYDVYVDGTIVPLAPEEVAHLMFTDPANPWWGCSPLQAAARIVDADNEAVRWNKIALQNRAVTDGVFTFPIPLGRDQWESAREQARDNYSGPDNARTPWVMGGGAQWNAMALTPVEMDFIESRKNNRAEIASVYGVPLPMIGYYEDATLANIETARKIFWADTVVPFLDGVRETLAHSLVPHFGDPAKLTIGPDLSGVEALREDFTEKITTAVQMRNIGIPLNTIIQRLELDIDPVEGGEVGIVPAAMVPLTMIGEPSGDPADPAVPL